MLGLASLTEKLRKEAAAAAANNNNNNNNAPSVASPTPAGGTYRKMSIRDRLLDKEVVELNENLPATCKAQWDDPDKLHDFSLTIIPDEGYWKNGTFQFHIHVTEDYNMAPPTVKCKTKIWHPNINEEGAVCLSLLRQSPFDDLGWAPTRRLKDVIWGLNQLFTDLVNFEEPLNNDAAAEYKLNSDQFEQKVKKYIREYCPRSSSRR